MFQKSVNRDIKSRQLQHLAENFVIWLETLGYKPRTVKGMSWHTQEFFAFLEFQGITHLKDFKNNHIHQYIEYLQHRPNRMNGGGLSASYINKHITALRLLSKYLQLTGKASIAIRPELLKTIETATYLSKAEIQALYEAASHEENSYRQRDTAMLCIYYGCGLRASEGAALNVSDILFAKDLVYVRKGKNYRERYVPMSKQVKQNIKEYILNQRDELLQGGKTEALLLGRRGVRWSVHGVYCRLKLLKNQTSSEELKKKSFGLHILRHSIATHLLQSGMKLEYISRFLGHKSLETTQKYTHLSAEALSADKAGSAKEDLAHESEL